MINLPRIHLWQLSPILLCSALMPWVWWRLLGEWQGAEQDLAHGIPAFLTYLFVLTHQPLRRIKLFRKEHWVSIASLILVLMLYLVSEVINIYALGYLALLCCMPLCFALIYGWQTTLRLWHLHLFLLLPLPFWDGLLEPLVNLASVVVSAVLEPMNFAMLIEGNSITVPGGRLLIAEGCSGIRYLMVAIILGYLLANLNGYQYGKLVLTVAIAALLGLIANWVRISLLILIGYYSDMQSNLMNDHEFFGWIVFAAFCLPAFYFAPYRKNPAVSDFKLPSLIPAKVLLIGVICSVCLNSAVHQLRSPAKTLNQTTVFSSERWQAKHYKPVGLASPTETYSTWQHPQTRVMLTHVYHTKSEPEDKLVPFFIRTRVGSHWFAEKVGTLSLPESHPLADTFMANQPATLKTEVFKAFQNDQRVLSLELFLVGGKLTTEYTKAKLLQIPALFLKKNTFEYFLLQKKCRDNDCQMAQQDILDALAQLNTSALKTPEKVGTFPP